MRVRPSFARLSLMGSTLAGSLKTNLPTITGVSSVTVTKVAVFLLLGGPGRETQDHGANHAPPVRSSELWLLAILFRY